MEIICVICKHTDRTEEQRERHVQTAEHIRNDEIYTMGLEHGQQHGKKQIATLEARIKELEVALEFGLYMLTIPAVGDVKKAIDYDPNMGPSKNVIADFEKKANSALKVKK